VGASSGKIIARKYAGVLDQLERVVRECPDELWESSLWPVKRSHFGVWPVRRLSEGRSAAKSREPLLQTYSAFWNISYHALFHVDFYLSGAELRGFEPPPPFREEEHRAGVVPDRPYTRDELLMYVAYNRAKVRGMFGALTDADAKRTVARAGVPFGEFLVTNLLHAQEHAAQLSLFLGQHGVEPRAGAMEQGRLALRDGVRDRTDREIDVLVKRFGGYARLMPLVFAGMCANITSREPCVVRFDVDISRTVRVTPDGATFEATAPKRVDAVVMVSPQDYLRWVMGDLDTEQAIEGGRMRVEGDGAVLRRLFS
jgi:hypothetical protein